MVALDLERPRAVVEDHDLAGSIALHPHGGLRLADVAQKGTEDELRHGAALLPGNPPPYVRYPRPSR
ncbi:MAG: hypothetical protein AUG75_22870 [Cyanobacteria bacterium 13_1_20CM_4_61_6]|nr:MAG: hypothetical protein AUG75_22870 [Cyanobacteria bacterium 13_1_20CM_4_61_6]